ncbi:hypothetical protein AC579_7054 [Pseudocercospora musae]|uniref:Uncharacterized protein n=1 Tax=Pseudocercospora musae TaxID=113226 RepID=A0A139GZX0_9PEZI|nr:hypothetical protein AC579_7054 [Pseudocercospora musae]
MIWLNSASYTEDFSTILRLARGAELDAEVDQKDWGGEDPLPKYLANAHITFPQTGARAEEKVETARYAIVAAGEYDEEDNANAKTSESPVSPVSIASAQEERETRNPQRAHTM